MAKKLLFVFNPHSGQGQIKNKLLQIIDIFTKEGYDVTAYPTQAARDGYEKIIKDGKNYDHIVCCGGDGTLDETVSGYLKAGLSCNIGYIPAGSTNDFATTLGIPKDMEKAAQIAVNGNPFRVDIGDMNGKTFVYVAAFGIFTDVSYQTDQNLKNIFGHAAYILEGARRLTQVKPIHAVVTANGETYDNNWIYCMVSNSESVGGMDTLDKKSVGLDDGVFEVMLIRMPENPVELNETLGALLLQQVDFKRVYHFKSNDITFTFPEGPTDWTIDGEFGGSEENVHIVNRPLVVPFMVDKKS